MRTAIARGTAIGMVLAALGSSGCKMDGFPDLSQLSVGPPAVDAIIPDVRRDELAGELDRFADYFESEIVDAAERINATAPDTAVRQASLSWRLRMIPAVQDRLAQEEPLRRMSDVWVLCVRMARYLRDGEGRSLFGDQQEIAVAAAERLQARSEEIVRAHVDDARMAELQARVDAFSEAHPIHGVFAAETAIPFSDPASGVNVVELVLGAPMLAAEGLGKGLDPTLSLAHSVDRMRDMLETYPSLLRWQMQFLVTRVEETPSIREVVKSAANVSESAARLTSIADDLPARLRSESTQFLEEFDSRQPELRSTLAEARQTVEAVERALDEAARAGDAWRETSAAVTATLEQVKELSNNGARQETGAPVESGKPFEIEEYKATADALTTTTQELRALLGEVRQFLDGEASERSMERVHALTRRAVGASAQEARGIVDHATYRGAQLSGVVFVLFAVYRLVVVRLAPRSG